MLKKSRSVRFACVAFLLHLTSAAVIEARSASTTTSLSSTTSAIVATCALDHCLQASKLDPVVATLASVFCELYIHSSPGTVTQTSTASYSTTMTTTITPALVTVTSSVTGTTTQSIGVLCTATATSSISTTILTVLDYPTEAHPTAAVAPTKRDLVVRAVTPAWMTAGCSGSTPLAARISSACSCFLTPHLVSTTISKTSTITKTVTAPSVYTTTTTTFTSIVSLSYCSSTTTTTRTSTAANFKCGMSFTALPLASTSGTITCPSAAAAASPSVNARHRIEGNNVDGTIFEDCIVAGPRTITTSSGGTHLCDGTGSNGGANAAPGTTITDQLDAASKLDTFPYDGTYDSAYYDYFITSIGQRPETSDQFWGVLRNDTYTSVGGCQSDVQYGDTSLWAFDAFNMNGFLHISPDYAVANAGVGSVTVTITSNDGDGTVQQFGGATFAGLTSGSNGQVTFPVPSTPGCYQMKATASSQLRSNAFYLTVL